MKKITAFVMLAFALLFTFGNSPATATVDNNNRREESRIKETITTYFKLRYEAQKTRSFADFSQIVASNNDATAKVRLFEGNEVTYTTNPELPSMMAHLEHTITLVKSQVDWRISSDQYRDENVRALELLSKEEVLENVRANY